MKKYLHLKAIEIPIYKGLLVVVLSNDADAVTKILPVIDTDRIFAHALTGTHEDTRAAFIVLNFHNPDNDVSHGTIAHEALHAAGFVADTCGFVPSFENDEPLAYLVGWVTNRVYEFMAEHKFKVK